jgi:hypothetical protein
VRYIFAPFLFAFCLSCSEAKTTPPWVHEGTLDCGAGEVVVGYLDVDGDGYGTAADRVTVCDTLPEGYAPFSNDCDDADTGTHPDADERCDGTDNDCDATTDEEAVDQRTYYFDGDLDGYGDNDLSVVTCNLPDGYVIFGDDCDDTDSTLSPGITETCDGRDNNCDGTVDEGCR